MDTIFKRLFARRTQRVLLRQLLRNCTMNRSLPILLAFVLTLTTLWAILPEATWAATFTVNSTADAVDASPGDGICETATVGECTLRAAIMEANALAEADTIPA